MKFLLLCFFVAVALSQGKNNGGVLATISTPTTTTHQGWDFALGSTAQDIVQVFPDPTTNITHVEITVDVARLEIGNGGGSFTTRAYFWHNHSNGGTKKLTWPGPVWYVVPGGLLNFTLHNNLGPNPVDDAGHNRYHAINTTNMHTHGLHADPNVDSIFKEAKPGESLTYLLPIIPEHYPGTHWYHAHKHGSATLQMMGGLLGANIVMPSDEMLSTSSTSSATAIAATGLATMTEEIIIMTPVRFESDGTNDRGGGGGGGGGGGNEFKIPSFAEMETAHKTSIAADHVLGSGVPTNPVLINGRWKPTIIFAPGESKYFRFVFAAIGLNPKLSFSSSSSCTMTILALDGVYISSPRSVSFLKFAAGRRMDVVFDCSNTVADTDMTVLLEDGDDGFNGQTVLVLRVDSSLPSVANSQTKNIPEDLGTIFPKPYYLEDVTTQEPDRFHSIEMEGPEGDCLYVMGEGPFETCGNFFKSQCCVGAAFDGERGLSSPEKYRHVSTIGAVEEWHVVGEGQSNGQSHPLHIHVNHFQLARFTGGNGARTLENMNLQIGDHLDTLAAVGDGGGQWYIRWKPHTFTGEAIFHCHWIPHEDRGLMSSYLIQPAAVDPPPTDLTASNCTPLWFILTLVGLSLLLVISVALVVFCCCCRKKRGTTSEGCSKQAVNDGYTSDENGHLKNGQQKSTLQAVEQKEITEQELSDL